MAELFLKRLELLPAQDAAEDAAYPFSLPAIRHLGEREFTAPVTVFVGDNGMGKSTLLEAIAVGLGLNAEGGSKNLRYETRATHSSLDARLLLTRGKKRATDSFFLRAESFYNVATALEQIGQPSGYGDRALHAQSHGESFWSVFLHRLLGGLYLFDEPEAALSPQRQLALLVRMHDLVQQGSQFVLATHAPILMAYPGAAVWEFGADGVREVDPRQTEHWQILRRFLADPDGMLRTLLD